MKAAHFSDDALDLIRLLHQTGTRYLIVGGEAVIYHGHIRLTGDIDFFYDRSAAGAEGLYDVLRTFWGGTIPGIASPAELRADDLVLQFGRPPNRIDLLSSVTGLDFDVAWQSRLVVALEGEEGAAVVNYVGLEQLITNKRATGRPQDLEDVRVLSSLRGERER